jgi:hypothetical protein
MEDSRCALDLHLLRPSPARERPALPRLLELPEHLRLLALRKHLRLLALRKLLRLPASRALPQLRKLPARTSQNQEPGTEQVLLLKRGDANRALLCAYAEEPPLARRARFRSGRMRTARLPTRTSTAYLRGGCAKGLSSRFSYAPLRRRSDLHARLVFRGGGFAATLRSHRGKRRSQTQETKKGRRLMRRPLR